MVEGAGSRSVTTVTPSSLGSDLCGFGREPPSIITATSSPRESIADCAVAAASWPVLFALETASGPYSVSNFRANSSSGTRTATVPRVSPRSQLSDGYA